MTSIMLVGEAWGEAEAEARLPFVGPAGYCLNKMLEDAEINRHECYITNVFNLRPTPNNDIGNLCGSRRDVKHTLTPLSNGKYILDRYLPELDRLYGELDDISPNVVICLGGTAMWALTGSGAISRVRGSVVAGRKGIKCLGTYHPSAVLRDWSLRPVTVMDLIKGKRQSLFPEIKLPQRELWLEPTIEDMWEFKRRWLDDARVISFDIETAKEQLTCIGFSPDPGRALVVPFVDRRRRDGNFWPDLGSELQAWAFVRAVLSSPTAKVGQNGLYDISWLWKKYGIPVANYAHDTMLLHHALYPELQKGLGFLGSIYTEEQSWKLLAKRSTTKREDE